LSPRNLPLQDLLLAGAVIGVLAMMVVPLPPFLLSLLLSLNLTLSLVVLLVTMYAREPLQFSTFPSLLLLATLFRLALNVSSTRLILLQGYAGEVIERFGQFVVGGNPVVGFVVFLILVVIQFVVITRGAERVAEVAARFTLDAMPGKQMSIDADLNAGLITEAEARRRREEIEREADFYGAMDGASKFVKGDAIASVVIAVVNVVGGFLVGVAQQGMSWSESLQRYTLLTVGDGLVTQIPALLLSTATGIIVTRAADSSSMAGAVAGQILSHPRVLEIAGISLLILGLVPGLPHLPFLLLGATFTFLYALSVRRRRDGETEELVRVEEEPPPASDSEAVMRLVAAEPLEVELGLGLLPLADPSQGGDLMERIKAIRRQLALELGFVMPLVRVRDNLDLPSHQYVLKMRGVEVARGEALPERYLALGPGVEAADIGGFEGRDPVFGMPARWIEGAARERAEALGLTVVDAPSVLTTHLSQVVRQHAHELLGRQEVKALLDSLRETHPALVEELVPGLMSLGEVQKVLQNLLREGIPIRDLVTILEVLADWAPLTKDPDRLTEQVRQALARQISQSLPVKEGRVLALSLDPSLEETFRRAVEAAKPGMPLSLDPDLLGRVVESLEKEISRLWSRGEEPVILCPPLVRLYFRRLTERILPRVKVVSYGEIAPELRVEVVGMVKAA